MTIPDALLPIRPWAETGDRTNPEDARVTLDRATGFPASFSTEGGDEPERQVVNQLLYELSLFAYQTIRQGIYEWDKRLDYAEHSFVQHEGILWRATAATGPSSSITEPSDTSGQTTWERILTEVPAEEPGTPGTPVGTGSGSNISWQWSFPLDNGAVITGYTSQFRTSGGGWGSQQSGDTNTRITTGLSPGTTYQMRVRATNSVGDSEWSPTGSATTDATQPGQVTTFTLTAGNAQIAFSITRPGNTGGATISGYDVQWRSGAEAWSSGRQTRFNSTTGTLTGLTNGTSYDVRVRARNSAGPGGWSTAQSAIPFSVPGTAGLTAAGADTAINVTLTAPNSNGREITSYQVQWKSGAQAYSSTARQLSTASTSATITGLTNSTEYTVRARALNVAGPGAWSTEATATPAPAATRPAKVPSLTVTPGAQQLVVAITAPDTGGSAITNYRVQWKSGAESYGAARQTDAGTTTNVTIAGLTNGTAYDVRARASNSVGDGDYSDGVSGTPVDVPAAPSLAVTAGDRRAAFTITPGSANGATISGHTVQWAAGAADFSSSNEQSTTSTTGTVTGLTNGTTYRFRARSSNSVGNSGWSTVVTGVSPVSAATSPGQVPSLSLGASNQQVIVTATAPSDGGSAITGYHFQWKSGNQSYSTTTRYQAQTSRTYTVTSLTNGTLYSFRARAVNMIGNGPWSAEQSARPSTVPGAPSISLTAGNGQIRVGITAPASDGGLSITQYRVEWVSSTQSYSSDRRIDTTSTNPTITGLTNDVTYTVRVRALNSIGYGDWSSERTAAPRDPATRPGAPTIALTAGNAQVSVGITAPSSDGGATITSYQVQWKSGSNAYNSTRQQTTTSTSTVIRNLSNGTTYTMRARAVNRVGTGNWSAEVTARPVAPAGNAPAAFCVNWERVVGDGRFDTVNVVFTVTDNGGSAVTRYDIDIKQTNGYTRSTNQTVSSFVGASPINGTAVTYRAGVVNAVGTTYTADFTIPAGTTSNTGTVCYPERAAGNAPAAFCVTWTRTAAGGGIDWLTFTFAGIQNGGSAITNYRVDEVVNNAYVERLNRTSTTNARFGVTDNLPATVRVGLQNAAGTTWTADFTIPTGNISPNNTGTVCYPAMTAPRAFSYTWTRTLDESTTDPEDTIRLAILVSDNGGSAVTGYSVRVTNADTPFTVSSATRIFNFNVVAGATVITISVTNSVGTTTTSSIAIGADSVAPGNSGSGSYP